MSGPNGVGGSSTRVSTPRGAETTQNNHAPKISDAQAVESEPAARVVDTFGPALRSALDFADSMLPGDNFSQHRANIGDAEVVAKRVIAQAGPAGARYQAAATGLNALAGKSRDDQLAALEKMSDAQLKNARGAIRAGHVPSHDVAMAVSVETTARTKWAHKGEGKEAAAHAKQLFVDGKLSLSDNPDGKTAAKGQQEETAFTTATGEVKLHESLARRPEALASFIAHEGQHSLRMKNGDKKGELPEEADAHVSQTRVWDELKGDAPRGSYRNELDETSKRYAEGGAAGVTAEVASLYAKGHALAGRDAKVTEVFDALVFDDKAIAKLTAADAAQLASAVGNMKDPRLGIDSLAAVYQRSTPEVQQAIVAHIEQYEIVTDPETKKTSGFDGERAARLIRGE